jgi:4,5-DOPA dioxygenase extradiol
MRAALPSLFLSHGAPSLALEDSPAGRFLDRLGPELPQPRALVVASAHYLAIGAAVGAAERPDTVHDFSGFPQALYALRYPAPGQPELAGEIVRRLRQAGVSARLDPARGLDHGVWVPLLRMFPAADIPVLPLAVNPRADAAWHYRLGQALASLRHDGVLVIGSGGFVHNLGELDWHDDGELAPWAIAFRDWLTQRLLQGDTAAVLDWQRQAPFALRAHPSTEHLLPLFVALGAAGEAARARHLHDSHQYGSLALDAFAFDAD